MKMEEKKTKKKSKNRTNNGDGDGDDNGNTNVEIDGHLKEKVPKHKKKKKSKFNEDEDNDHHCTINLEDNGDLQKKKRKRDSFEKTETKENSHSHDDNVPKPKKQKKKKHKHHTHKSNLEDDPEKFQSEGQKNTKKVLPPLNTETKGDGLIRGKRFTPEEDEILKQAVLNYITSHNLGDNGLQMVLNCRSHRGLDKCWREIRSCIPYRPHTAIYRRAHVIFERGEKRPWTPEEIQYLKESYEKYGKKTWKMVADELGRTQFHVRLAWQHFKVKNPKKGRWSMEECQGLYDLVNLDLQMKVPHKEKRSKHGMLRDNIPWTSISEKLSTRSDAKCCWKWYHQLTSPLVSEKKWSDADDYWMVGQLYEIDAACVEDVDWDNILEHRSGEICKKRWDQMVVCIENHRGKTFGEHVMILAKRYRPDLAEAR